MNKLTAEKCRDLIHALKAAKSNFELDKFAEYNLQALEIALPVLEQEGGWISCNDRMPEETEIIGGDDFSPDVLTINQHGEQWVCCTHWGKWIHTKHSDCVITHWLRLPAEPQPSTTTQIDNDGWIDWGGGKCPVADDAVIEVQLRNGEVINHLCETKILIWADRGMGTDIIAYRVIENDGSK
ncbi:DUF551 domain-containing protein [Pantoea sp. Al-1710]|uniref:DUF551 domain-containing protein n=1 Tax=Candidatus Pantoea communis TaxID=2608354 RepID=A0ABX0RSK9_9GAMM|nr:DUF551 domain-containing protein [Pantoea communis]NIG20566.1 DUF551 domain-containing protein [Pantoea communis]